jgi:hypothetical protein
MNQDARSLDQAVRDWWLRGGDDSLFATILDISLTCEPSSLVPVARALSILENADLQSKLAERVEEIRDRFSELLNRTKQVDALGDLDNEPETLFSVLGDELVGVGGYDADKLRNARLKQHGSRVAAAQGFLSELGWDTVSEKAKNDLELALADLKERERFEAWGLFVDGTRGEAIALGLKLVRRDIGDDAIVGEVAGSEIVQQARIVNSQMLSASGCELSIEWPAAFTGESIGLPLAIAALTLRGDIPRDALLASTGRLDISGNVLGVAHITEKISAAQRLGMRRVVVPKENFAEAKAAANGIAVLGVGHISELISTLRQSVSAIDLDFGALCRLVRVSARDYGLLITEEKQQAHGRCFVMGNTSGRVNVWVYNTGRVLPQGAAGKALDAAQKLIRERVPPDPQPRASQTFDMLSEQFQDAVRVALEQIGACHEPANKNELWRVRL